VEKQEKKKHKVILNFDAEFFLFKPEKNNKVIHFLRKLQNEMVVNIRLNSHNVITVNIISHLMSLIIKSILNKFNMKSTRCCYCYHSIDELIKSMLITRYHYINKN